MKPPHKPQDPLWHKVSKTVTPLRPHSSRPKKLAEEFRFMMRVPPLPKPLAASQMPELEINQDKKVRRGRVVIDAKIDLHDMTLAEAFPALKTAVLNSHAKKRGCLLVITGKGLRLGGVIRGAFPGWINDPKIRPLIATYAPAHIQHGGSGAWYVFLKKA